ncbi:DNA mismatch endonuclease (patch repair protein) [Rhizobium petrolearium]|uniref:very short patch repair endonuclease n=1 Tax=Neorhizobium petrolearium TaxID=515361 RepID=UPI001AEAB880|nr:DNA mismatch endonuclease Vsr [Neorhizobium petrolearium]MBP1848267.1 DNA mismatch endonuclease (patch repair protein) [Neorhizobium petrolearium]
MTDTLSPSARSERMSRVRGRDTKPELRVRRLLHSLGYRFRLHRRDLPGSPDIVLPRHHTVIFVHGCFWHRHDDPNCRLARMPKSRLDFWGPKLASNQVRDERVRQSLTALGWRVLVIWECEVKDEEKLKDEIVGFLAGKGASGASD